MTVLIGRAFGENCNYVDFGQNGPKWTTVYGSEILGTLPSILRE